MSEEGGIFDPLVSVFRWTKNLFQGRVTRPTITFITAHYMYMIGLSITISIILYPLDLDYIDALFFAAGASTQSGLNPIDVNKMHLYQQVTMMLTACIANPIFINTFVVFIRLYWFTRRFQHVVEQDREAKRTGQKTITRTRSEMVDSGDQSPKAGVSGKEITVLHHTTRPNGMSGSTARPKEAEKIGINPHAQSVEPTPEGSSNAESSRSDRTDAEDQDENEKIGDDSNAGGENSSYLGLNPTLNQPTLNREITFAADVADSGAGQLSRDPEPDRTTSDVSQHIAFIQRQQGNAHKQGGTLRIPGPKDFDRGEVPMELDDSDDEGLHRPQTRNTLGPVDSEEDGRPRFNHERTDTMVDEERDENTTTRRAITINEPSRPPRQRRNQNQEEEAGPTSTLQRIKSTLGRKRTNSNRSQMPTSFAKTWSNITSSNSYKADDPMPYLSWQATTGRNSQFTGLNEEQREELGGIEYRSLKTLAVILIGYFVGFHLLGMVVLLPWIMQTERWRSVITGDGLSPVWWGIFTPASMFNDLGFTLTPDSMSSFQTATLPLLFGSFLIIIGNTGFPCMLRFTIWVVSKFVPYGGRTWEELRFLLDHPRRCFTLLFPSKATWWLFWVLVALNGIDLIFFIILDLHDATVTTLPPGFRVLDGWFQAASTRTAGFSCVNIADLHPAIQVSYLIMMYISVFPIAISVRRTNVYEEKSLGLWGGEEDEEGGQSYVGQHLRRQLSFDLWFIFLGWFIICIVEGGRLARNDEYAFTMFSVLFEIVSAYGTVGLSLGYPGTNTSFSAQLHVISKLVIIAMMIRGRHRGLPYALDRAILLPSEKINKKEEETLPRRSATFTEGQQQQPQHQPDEFRRNITWEDGDIDDNGLPRQHTIENAHSSGIGPFGGPDAMRLSRRRASAFSTASDERRHKRTRSLSQVIVSGLSAGPTMPRHRE